ncbi:Protein kintoun [Sergentomyia squamirostris]
MNKEKWEDLDLTTDEIKSLTDALKKEEFRKLLVEYCEELNDPENKRKFEDELTQLEAERGIDITFINPEPGYVIKTTVDGQMKGFINVCQSGKVQRPVSEYRAAPGGERGLNWTLPHTQAPPRKDLDNKKVVCMVYDVVFHPDALHLATKNHRFRDIVSSTALDAVESAFRVKLDRTNVKYPKLAFKGTPRPTVIRCKSANSPQCEPSPLDSIYPPLKEQNGEAVRHVPESPKPEAYTTPKYTITHRKDVDYSEFTQEIDSKINTTVPKELVISVELPLLKSSANVTLDVTRKHIFLMSERQAKYKLDLNLPYEIEEREGGAKFDSTTRQLLITLPVVKEHRLHLIDVTRQDSGVDSMPNTPAESPTTRDVPDDEVFDEKFLDDSISYTLPTFTCNALDNTVAFTLNVKNIDPSSVAVKKEDNSVHIKFASIGGGIFPSHYAFMVKFTPGQILDVSAEPWDNNLILQCELENITHSDHYDVGLNGDTLKTYTLPSILPASLPEAIEDDSFRIEVNSVTDDAVSFSVVPSSENTEQEEHPEEFKKVVKKKNRKQRSLSESFCDTMSADHEEPEEERGVRKSRSFSESSGDDHSSPRYKGILKRSSSYNPSTAGSSIDDQGSFSVSLDLGVGSSFDGIPEEQELSESCKKTVRFSDVIRKQLFRSNSSILGRRMKNMKKRAKKRAQDGRRMSESENSENEEKEKPTMMGQRGDSGVELYENTAKVKHSRKKESQKKFDNTADLDFKSGMIFNLEI